MKMKIMLVAFLVAMVTISAPESHAGGGGGRDNVVCDAGDPICENFNLPDEGAINPALCTIGQSGTVGRLSGDPHVNVRSGAGKGYSVIGKLFDGESFFVNDVVDGDLINDVDLHDSSSRWLVIEFNGAEGYISALYGMCDADGFDPIDNGDIVVIVDPVSGDDDFLPPIDGEDSVPGTIDETLPPPDFGDDGIDNTFPPADNASCQEYRVTNLSGDVSVRLRAEATRSSQALAAVPDNATVEFIAMVDGEEVYDSELTKISPNPTVQWAHVTYQGKTGYISGLYLVPACSDFGPGGDSDSGGDFTPPDTSDDGFPTSNPIDCDANPGDPICGGEDSGFLFNF